MTRAALAATLAALAAAACTGPPASAQGPPPPTDEDPVARFLLGSWEGGGTDQGNRLSVTRSWAPALDGAFLAADLRVAMPGGATFGGLMYWRAGGGDRYDVVWLDGLGRMQRLEALRDPATGRVETTYLDALAEGGPAWRRWTFEPAGPDAYVERLWGPRGDGWEVLLELRLRRVAGGGGPP